MFYCFQAVCEFADGAELCRCAGSQRNSAPRALPSSTTSDVLFHSHVTSCVFIAESDSVYVKVMFMCGSHARMCGEG